MLRMCGANSATFMKLTQLAVIVSLVGVIRSDGFEATGRTILILGKANHSGALQDVSFKALSGSAAAAVTEPLSNEKSGASLGWMPSAWLGWLSELAFMLTTTAVSITLASSFKNKHSKPKESCVVVEDGAEDVHKMPEPIVESQCSQAELDWVDSARTGMVRLTDDVYCAAMQWWLEQPLPSIVDRLGPQDQQLLRPVAELLERGREDEANKLLVQIGRLDRMERELQKVAKEAPVTSPTSSPLHRSLPDMKSSTALLRKSVASSRVGAFGLPLGPREVGFENGQRSPQAIGTPTTRHQPFSNTPTHLEHQTDEFLMSSPFSGECWRGCGA